MTLNFNISGIHCLNLPPLLVLFLPCVKPSLWPSIPVSFFLSCLATHYFLPCSLPPLMSFCPSFCPFLSIFPSLPFLLSHPQFLVSSFFSILSFLCFLSFILCVNPSFFPSFLPSFLCLGFAAVLSKAYPLWKYLL
ncbi:hypothetical protein CRENBAI_013018 [Crenichthys baileyi]|uniref:Uncharacterized protein n=1 Tax=Crenichthys baileyi TaxID=28760 RepID=A0AAV9SQ96_9TELE